MTGPTRPPQAIRPGGSARPGRTSRAGATTRRPPVSHAAPPRPRRPQVPHRHRGPRRLRLTPLGRAVVALSVVTVLVLAALGVHALRSGGDATAVSATRPQGSPSVAPVRPTTSAEPARDANGVPVAVAQAVAAVGGDLSVAVYDATTGRTWTYQDRPGRTLASTSKLGVLGAELRHDEGGTPSAAVLTDEREMIGQSDNEAAERLHDHVGSGAYRSFYAAVGAGGVAFDDEDYFGLDTSSAADQVAVMRAFAYPNAVLDDAARARAAELFADVAADQHWGASAGVPTGVTVQLKNGWLPLDADDTADSSDASGGRWVVDTVGHVAGQGHDYVVAIMSGGNATEQAGIDRLEAVSTAVWQTSGS